MTSAGAVPTATLLVAYATQDPTALKQFQQLADRLAGELSQPVIPCPLDRGDNSVLDGIRQGLQQGAVKFVVLPIFLSPAEYRESSIAKAVEWASRRWSFLSFHISPSLDWRQWVHSLTELVADTAEEMNDTGVVLVHPATSNRELDVRADMAKLAHLLQGSAPLARVELAHSPQANDLEAAMRHCALAGAKKYVAVPAFIFENSDYARLCESVATLQSETGFAIKLTRPLSRSQTLRHALSLLHEEALADDTLLPVSWDEVRRQVEASNADHRNTLVGPTDLPDDEIQFQDLTQRINAILPPRYQNGDAVSAAPMASADLKIDDAGNVAWDEMWGLDDPDSPFCELALAGGPPHRGDLLEPVAAAECKAAPGKYAAVLAEIERGIALVAKLDTVQSSVPGWLGVQCESEEMAIWLLRAIIVENVMVRREADVLFLPAGPDFALAGEIKNVVTVVAKTVHYWAEHQLAMRLMSA